MANPSSILLSPSAPPLYDAGSSNPPFLLNLSTIPPAFSFVSGHLGIGPASVQGELQLKQLSSDPHLQILRLHISFHGLERSQQFHIPIFLVQQHQLLWHSSPSSNLSPEPSAPPSVIPFQFPLTPDLPHCIHLSNGSGLHYELEAKVSYTSSRPSDPKPATLQHLLLTVPVHIVRYSNPAQHPVPPPLQETLAQPFSLSPLNLFSSSPTPIQVSLSQTLLRHSEPLALQVRIPPPDQGLVREKGLCLRSVRAELHRHIRTRQPASALSPPVEAAPSLSDQPASVINSLLAMSGKSCRFSSTRPIFLRLTLHPRTPDPLPGPSNQSTALLPASSHAAPDSRCSTITQSTILHDVYFSVTVSVQISGRSGERFDVQLNAPVGMVPDWPPDSEPSCLAASSKTREVAAEEQVSWPEDELGHQGPAPTYFEADTGQHFLPSTSTSARLWPAQTGTNETDDDDEDGDEDEEEYDGYESLTSRAGHDGPAPPTIDEDESPPPAPENPPEGFHLAAPPQPEELRPAFEFVRFETAHLEAAFGRLNTDQQPILPLNPPLSTSHQDVGPIPARPEEEEEAHRPPAYAAGWTTLEPLPPPPDMSITDDNPSSNALATATSSLNAPPPYAEDFGCLLPPGSIGVVDLDGELDGFVVRR